MTLADLQAFVAVAEAGSINRAALRLGLTQPAATRRVQNFEAALGGVPLLDRSSKPPTLTPAGRRVLEHCRRVLAVMSDLKASALDTAPPAGEFRIGLPHGLAEILLASPIDRLQKRFPQLELRISCQWSSLLIKEVDNGGLDCGIALLTEHQALPRGLSAAVIGSERVVVVSGKGLKLPHTKRHLRIRDLSGQAWVVNTSGCGYRDALARAFDRSQARMKVSAEVLGYELQLSLIARGGGLGLVPLRKLDASTYRRQLRVLHLEDFRLAAEVAVLRRSSLGSLGPAVDYLAECLSEHLGHANSGA